MKFLVGMDDRSQRCCIANESWHCHCTRLIGNDALPMNVGIDYFHLIR